MTLPFGKDTPQPSTVPTGPQPADLPRAAHSPAALTCHTWDPETRRCPRTGSATRSTRETSLASPHPRRPHSPPGPPKPFAEPCSPLPPWLRHLREHPATRTARGSHPHLATAWSPGSRLASPGTSRHGPSLSAGAGAGAMVAKRRKPAGRRRKENHKFQHPVRQLALNSPT